MALQIKDPCSEDWNKMKVGIISRHCENCQKAVYDLTQMSREEILKLVFENRNKGVCGRAYTKQLDFSHEEIIVTIKALEKRHGNRNMSFYLLSMAALALLSCKEPKALNVENQILSSPDTQQTVVASAEHDSVKPLSCDSQLKTIDKPHGVDHQIENGKIITGELALPVTMGGIEIPGPENFPDTNIVADDFSRTFVEEMPEFPGGLDSLYIWMKRNVNYPEEAKQQGIEGKVYVQIIITKEGKITDKKILRSVNENMSAEVLRVIDLMPHWKPGREKGKHVPVRFIIPFIFKL